MCNNDMFVFLVTCTRLYKPLCQLVGPLVGWSIGLSIYPFVLWLVRWSVCWSVGPWFWGACNLWQSVKSGYFNGIFCCFEVLRESPRVTDGWCANPGGWWGRSNLRDLHLMILRGLFPTLPAKKMAELNLIILLALLAIPGWQMGGAPPQEDNVVGKIRKT